jgi:prevent-host-death family protein
MKTVNIHAAKTQLSRLVDEAAAGEEIIIARAGKPIARLAPLRATGPRRRPGLMSGRIRIARDFDAPLPAEVLGSFYGPLEPKAHRS